MSVVGSVEHRSLAYRAAIESIVLLANRGNILPIGAQVRSILVTGPTATSSEVLLGNYYGLSDALVTLLEGIVGQTPEGIALEYLPGAPLTGPSRNPDVWTAMRALASDVTIVCLGLSPLIEGEEGAAILSAENGDRSDIGLPAPQADFLRALAQTGAKIVLILTGGSPLALGPLADMVEAILYVWYPGQEGGRAVADVLFGKAVPSGKLPLTFPHATADLPPFSDYSMVGRTYRYATVEPAYPFGFGLSYTRFAYAGLQLERSLIKPGENLTARVSVTNVGSVAADEVVQLYLADLESSVPVADCQLVAFRRIHLDVDETQQVAFTVTPQMMAVLDDEGKPFLESGKFRLTVGGCSPGTRGQALGAAHQASALFEMRE